MSTHLKIFFSLMILTLPMLACGNQEVPADIPITPLPTLTPTVSTTEADQSMESSAGDTQSAEIPQESQQESSTNPDSNGQADSASANGQTESNPNDSPATKSNSPVIIVSYDKVMEVVDLQNVSDTPQDLVGWNIVSELGPQKCNLAGTLDPGETMRVWALAESASNGGYNCGFSREIWDDIEPDPAVLYNAEGLEASRMENPSQ